MSPVTSCSFQISIRCKQTILRIHPWVYISCPVLALLTLTRPKMICLQPAISPLCFCFRKSELVEAFGERQPDDHHRRGREHHHHGAHHLRHHHPGVPPQARRRQVWVLLRASEGAGCWNTVVCLGKGCRSVTVNFVGQGKGSIDLHAVR